MTEIIPVEETNIDDIIQTTDTFLDEQTDSTVSNSTDSSDSSDSSDSTVSRREQCNICFEHKNRYYKICSCINSRICNICLNGLNIHNIITCPLCRTELNVETINRLRDRNILLSKYLFNIFIVLFIQIGIPIIYFNGNNANDRIVTDDLYLKWVSKDEHIIFIILLSVLILQPLNIIMFTYLNNVRIELCVRDQYIYIKTNTFYTLFMESILFILNTRSVASYYIMFIIIPGYGALFLAGLVIIINIYLKQLCTLYSINNFRTTRIVPVETVYS